MPWIHMNTTASTEDAGDNHTTRRTYVMSRNSHITLLTNLGQF